MQSWPWVWPASAACADFSLAYVHCSSDNVCALSSWQAIVASEMQMALMARRVALLYFSSSSRPPSRQLHRQRRADSDAAT
jgi:hypothetical protein